MASLTLSLVACTVKSSRPELQSNDAVNNSEISLKSDRARLEDLRKDIPEVKKQENDELAYLLSLVGGQIQDKPQKVRGKFDREVRKKRGKFKKTMQKERKVFSKAEKKKRDQFLKKQRSERDSFTGKKRTKDARKEFYDNHSSKRKEFFEEQREKRKEFESDMRQRSNDFNGDMREVIRQFYQEWNLYKKRFAEQAMMKRKMKKSRSNQFFNTRQSLNPNQVPKPKASRKENLLKEFEDMKDVPAEPLSTDDK